MCTIPPPSSLNLDWWLLLCTNDDSHEWRLTLGNDNTHHVYSLFLLFPFFLLSTRTVSKRSIQEIEIYLSSTSKRNKWINRNLSLLLSLFFLFFVCRTIAQEKKWNSTINHQSAWQSSQHEEELFSCYYLVHHDAEDSALVCHLRSSSSNTRWSPAIEMTSFL